jgi:DnaJ family protein C protein 25
VHITSLFFFLSRPFAFQKIARAYEVLTNKETRDEYDFYRDRPDEYFKKYGSSVLWKYAPKSNTAAVIVGLLALLSCMTLWIKKHRWRTIADHIIKAASENRSLREGGSSESVAIREQAIEILEQQVQEMNGTISEGDAAKLSNSIKRKKIKGLDKKEKKEADQEALKPIIVVLVEAIDDFGGGYAKPTWKDLFVVKLALFPLVIGSSILWWTKYLFRRVRKLDYSDEETEYFTRHAVGDIIWGTLSEEERKDLEKRELWIQENHEGWNEEKEIKLLSPKEQKLYLREKKRSGGKSEKED